MTTTYDDAKTATTQAEYRAATLATLAAPPVPLTAAPVAGWSNSAPHRLLVEDFSARMAEESALRAKVAKTISPTTAAEAGADWVDAAIGWFDEERIPAAAAAWDVPFEVAPTSAPLTVGPSTVIQIQSTGGVIFVLAQATDVLFNAAGSYLGTLRFVARLAGASGNVAEATLEAAKILTGPAGLSIADTPEQVTQGRDIETPQQAITRCLGKWARLGAGWTRQAFDYLIPSALLENGDPVAVTRWRVEDDNPTGPGTVRVTIAGPSGPSTVDEVTAVFDLLGSTAVRPLGSGGVTVVAASSGALTVNVTLVGDGSNVNLETDAEAAALALADAFPIGPATLNNDLLEGVLLGGGYSSIKIAAGDEIITIAPTIPGFTGAVSISSIDLAAPHDVPTGAVLELTIVVTVA